MKNIKGPKYSLPKKISDKKFDGIQALLDYVVERGIDPDIKFYYGKKVQGKVHDYLKP